MNMNVFQLKLLAIALMVLDHIGAYLFPDLVELRILGRLAFPLFGWLIANGYRHTSNVNRYLFRLLLFAFISQVPFALVGNTINDPLSSLNIFFTLWIGLATIIFIDRHPAWPTRIGVILCGIVLGWALPIDYGVAGVLSIVAFHYSFKRYWLMLGLQLALFILFFSVPLFLTVNANLAVAISPVRLWQPVAAASVLFIAQYNEDKGRSIKYWFYLFYPVHLLILYWLQQIIYT